jgi:hypothetical protein
MSEHEQSESRTIGAFLLGFLTGVLVCLGAGGTLYLVQGRRIAAETRAAEMRALEARAAAEAMRHLAQKEADATRKARLGREEAEDRLPMPKVADE